uniref:Uncharacterized protein n=1 Tax=Picea glauca TaxID=3330 RepID=A0A101LYI0_PICGL|nr:hypothetical protein ABT39_MTgene5842 [Picea glauca]QHR92325.1 hypothetical protein Q903MT_gene6367 [Picea sitchensis]
MWRREGIFQPYVHLLPMLRSPRAFPLYGLYLLLFLQPYTRRSMQGVHLCSPQGSCRTGEGLLLGPYWARGSTI